MGGGECLVGIIYHISVVFSCSVWPTGYMCTHPPLYGQTRYMYTHTHHCVGRLGTCVHTHHSVGKLHG